MKVARRWIYKQSQFLSKWSLLFITINDSRSIHPHLSLSNSVHILSTIDLLQNQELEPRDIAMSSSIPATSSTKSASSTRILCRHGSYGPTCMCNVADTSLPSSSPPAQVSAIPREPRTSRGDQVRAVLGIKEHKRCSHGSYGPACICDI
jgi:hypothetical protein